MLFGLDVSNYGKYADPRTLAGLAREAEESGWDGFFIFDHILSTDFSAPLFDPWIALAAIAMNTERLRIGPMVTPAPRRRPWKLARETISLDHLSNGRLILGVGLDGPPDREFDTFDESGDARVRAGLLNEGLDVLAGMWTGEPFAYDGEHYRVKEQVFLPTPVQSPRIPVWVSAKWRNRGPSVTSLAGTEFSRFLTTASTSRQRTSGRSFATSRSVGAPRAPSPSCWRTTTAIEAQTVSKPMPGRD